MGLFSAIGGIVSGFIAKGAAKRAQRRAADDRRAAQKKLAAIKRQPIINPYDNVKDLSSLAKDLSGKLSNPFASLGVSTAAAEMQIEEADIALANTLATLRATGASAGGATALAQAALQSKKGVAATIEQQEAQNEKLRAQGEADLEQRRIAEAQRIEGIEMSEEQRVQQAKAQGEQFMFNARETREMQKINRTASQLDNARAAMAQASRDGTAAITGAIGGITTALTKVGKTDPVTSDAQAGGND